MAVSVSGTQPGTPTSLTSSLTMTVTEDDANNKFLLKLFYGGLTTPSGFNVLACTTKNGDAQVTTTNSFSGVRPGDAIAITGSGFSGTTVLAVAADGKSLTASSNATATVTATAAFTPPAPTGEIAVFELAYNYSSGGAANNLAGVTLTGAKYDGLGKTNSPTLAQGASLGSLAFALNITTWLANQRQ